MPVPEHPTPDIVDAKGDVVMPDTQPGGGGASVGREAFRARQARARRVPGMGSAGGGVGTAGAAMGVRMQDMLDARGIPTLLKIWLCCCER